MKNRGYALSAIIYPLLLICLSLILSILFNLESKRSLLENLKGSMNTCSYQPGEVVQEFSYTGKIEEFQVPCNGIYKLEVWGAQGGTYSAVGGKGGYAYGNRVMNKSDILYIVVGGSGKAAATSWKGSAVGGYNGGGMGFTMGSYSRTWYGSSGGGATHIATATGLLKDLAANKESVLIVAGGGGGAMYDGGGNGGGGEAAAAKYNGGAGGGTSGFNGAGTSGGGGTQTSGGTSVNYNSFAMVNASFGQGAYITVQGPGCGGGGGYYGGGMSSHYGGAGGGSGYIGGVTGGQTSNGQQSGNGYAKITFVSSS